MIGYLTVVLAFVSSAAIASPYDDPYAGSDIQLMCYGEAQKTVAETHNGYEWDDRQHKYVSKSTVETGKSNFDTAINVSIQGNQGTIHMPKALIPPLHDGGDNGWWRIDDLMVGHDEIRGRFRLNSLNKPTIVINRRSGIMTLDGMIKFTGRCDADDGHRRF